MENNISLNISMLSSVLRVNEIDIKTLRENEQKNNYYKKLPNYSPLLLSIACNTNKEFPDEICLNAAIQLKNYINSYWRNNSNNIDEGDNIIINEEDKKYIRTKILDAVIYVVEIENIKILKQFNQCVKKLCKYYFKEKIIDYNKEFINRIIKCLNSKNLKQTYAGIILFYQLSKIFEFDSEENQKIYNEELIKVNNYLLSSLYECKDINNAIQAQFAYKILKIFFKSFQGAIPELFTQEKIFEQWINFITNVIKNPVNESNMNNNKKNIFFKLKRVCYQTITRIVQKFSRYSTNNEKTSFENMINNKYISIFFEIYKTIFINCFNNQLFIDDYGKTCIYNFFSILMENGQFSKMVLDMFINDKNNELLNHIIQDCYITYDDLELYHSDPKKYLAEKLEEINSIFIIHVNFLLYLIYNDIHFCLKKESILYLIKNNNSIIMKYLKKDFLNFIEKIICLELNSPYAFLLGQVYAFINSFKTYKYTNNNLVETLAKNFSNLMQKRSYITSKI